MQAAHDFKVECDSIAAILAPLDDTGFATPTLFKGWTIKDILGHLHLWNIAADQTLNDPEAFLKFTTEIMGSIETGKTHIEFQDTYFKGKTGKLLYYDWCAYYLEMADRFSKAEPEARVKWVGPDMSVRSCIIARQMEHWAHAQAIFDVLGIERQNEDRLKNVAHIGVQTYSWSFKVNGLIPPQPKPYIKLTAPSGAIWQWNEPQADNKVIGCAVDFSQVVTQCRNIADTSLTLTGDTAVHWMSIAQCFAGGPEKPPSKDSRHITRVKG